MFSRKEFNEIVSEKFPIEVKFKLDEIYDSPATTLLKDVFDKRIVLLKDSDTKGKYTYLMYKEDEHYEQDVFPCEKFYTVTFFACFVAHDHSAPPSDSEIKELIDESSWKNSIEFEVSTIEQLKMIISAIIISK